MDRIVELTSLRQTPCHFIRLFDHGDDRFGLLGETTEDLLPQDHVGRQRFVIDLLSFPDLLSVLTDTPGKICLVHPDAHVGAPKLDGSLGDFSYGSFCLRGSRVTLLMM